PVSSRTACRNAREESWYSTMMICSWFVDALYEYVTVRSRPIDLPIVRRGASNEDPTKTGSIWRRSRRKNCFVRLVTASVARLAISSRAAEEIDSSVDTGVEPT